jgi:hypothetical protein
MFFIKWLSHQVTRWLSDQVTSYQVTSEEDDEHYHRSYNFKFKEKMYCCHAFQWFRQICRSSSNVYNFLCDSLLQWPSTNYKDITISVWTKFGKSMLLTWTTVFGLLTRWKTFRFIRENIRRKNKKYCIIYNIINIIQKLFNKQN